MSPHDPKTHKEFDNGEPAGPLAVCGVSYNTATLAEREPFQISREDMVPALKELISIRGVKEAMILSTCNRFEAYLVVDEGEEAFSLVREFFIRFKGIDPLPSRKIFYVRHGTTAARHLFKVTGGLDSMVLGEYQIQGQVKEAYSTACSVNGPGKVLHRLFHAAFRAGKSIRSHTAIGKGRMSVAGMAVGLLQEKLNSGDPVLLIGVNENIRIVADGLKNFSKLLFANRTQYKAEKMGIRFRGEGHGLEALPDLLKRVRGVVSCTGAKEFVIREELLNDLVKGEAFPDLCVDMAVPRDIERPKTPAFPCRVVDLEDLKAFRDNQMSIRKEELPAAKRVVEDMVCTFQAWMEGAFDDGVGAMVKEYDRIRQNCLKGALASFPVEDHHALEQFSRDLMRRLLKVPTQAFLKKGEAPK